MFAAAVIAWQAAVYGSDSGAGGNNLQLSPELVLQVMNESKHSKTKKLSWLNKNEADHLTADSSQV